MTGPASSRRVVVVDNDPGALDLAALDLELEGHEIVGRGRTGDDAVRLVSDLAPEVLVVDHRMPPGPTGLDVATRLAAEGSPTRVVIYSNYQSVDLIESSRRLGATFVPKGNLRTLRRAVAGA